MTKNLTKNLTPAQAKKVFDEKLNKKCLTKKLLKQKIEKLQAKMSEVDDDIKDMLGDIEEYKTNTFNIFFKNQVSKRVDTKKVKADFPEVADACMIEVSSRPLIVK